MKDNINNSEPNIYQSKANFTSEEKTKKQNRVIKSLKKLNLKIKVKIIIMKIKQIMKLMKKMKN